MFRWDGPWTGQSGCTTVKLLNETAAQLDRARENHAPLKLTQVKMESVDENRSQGEAEDFGKQTRYPEPALPYTNNNVPNILPRIKPTCDGDDPRTGAFKL